MSSPDYEKKKLIDKQGVTEEEATSLLVFPLAIVSQGQIKSACGQFSAVVMAGRQGFEKADYIKRTLQYG